MDVVMVLHPDGSEDKFELEHRVLAEACVIEREKQCHASPGKRIIKRSWAEDIVIEGKVESIKKKKK